MEKVKLPREIAEDLAVVERECQSPYKAFHQIEGGLLGGRRRIKRWAFERDGGTPDLLMAALVNGYEVEETPEDRLLAYYRNLKRSETMERIFDTSSGSQFRQGMQSVEETLNILGITIEGINAKEGE